MSIWTPDPLGWFQDIFLPHRSGGRFFEDFSRQTPGNRVIVYMKTLLNLSVLAFLLAVTARSSFAYMSIEEVSKARAKELGMEVRTVQAGPDVVRIELEFKADGDLKSFERVDLELMEGGKLVLESTLKEEKATPGHVMVGFAAARAHLDGMTLRVVTGTPRDYTGYDLRLKDFIEPVKAAGAATSEEEARFLAAVRKAFEARDATGLDALSCWDRTPADRKKSMQSSYAALVAEKGVIYDFKLADPDMKFVDRPQIENGVTYHFNLPITRQLELKAIKARETRRHSTY